jgi:hypothetical protein
MKTENQLSPLRVQRWTAILGIVVLFAFVSVQILHVHAVDVSPGSPAQSQSHCSICAATHSPALPTQAGSIGAPVQVHAVTVAVAPQLRSHLELAPTFIRPPPVL